jgi:hypothetical protein
MRFNAFGHPASALPFALDISELGVRHELRPIGYLDDKISGSSA